MKSYIGINIFIQGLVKQFSINADVYIGKTIQMEWKYHPRFGIVKIVEKDTK